MYVEKLCHTVWESALPRLIHITSICMPIYFCMWGSLNVSHFLQQYHSCLSREVHCTGEKEGDTVEAHCYIVISDK